MKTQHNQCFKWSVTRALNPVDKKTERITKLLMEQSKNLNWDGIEFPVKLKDIGRFEKIIKFLLTYLVLTVQFTLSE